MESLSPLNRDDGPPAPKKVVPKTPSQRQRIKNSIKNNLLFRNLDQEQPTTMRVSLHTILRRIVLTKQQKKKTTGSWGTTNSTRASSSGTTEETYYPTERAPKRNGDKPGSPHLLQNPFVHDPAYIKRIRPTATQKPPPASSSSSSSSPSPARKARLSMEQSWLSPSSCPQHVPETAIMHPHISTTTTATTAPSSLAVCFPGSSSQYMGMGSFLRHLPEFRHTWEEALAHLNACDSWMAGLHLQDHFLSLGYPPNHAQILAAPPPPSDSSARPLDHIVFDGSQNELSRCSNTQPAILITSMAYLRTLEIGGKVPLRSMAKVYAGHSLGEYTACRSMELAGLAPSTTRSMRGESNDEGAGTGSGRGATAAQMSALLISDQYQAGLGQKTYDYWELIELVEWINARKELDVSVQIASFNSSNQIVLSGTRPGVLAACAHLQDLEIANRAADLPYSLPFHSLFMKPAADELKAALDAVRFRVPDRPILITRNCPRSQ
ncbi:hypothetical protein PCASD_10685 [Puccinia coronata f. sp. avenae]|uniref:[acyl-carrier-protein] S-malonyltransferase n=1 Tax=Puccinia coronata f. sp. avenae TaxID=200324 RepID=A0A2N5UI88_9BASI|nr:hypothetical protein PCASD_10685 [Puccinia coronata f. sp. avenae]